MVFLKILLNSQNKILIYNPKRLKPGINNAHKKEKTFKKRN